MWQPFSREGENGSMEQGDSCHTILVEEDSGVRIVFMLPHAAFTSEVLK